jgi:hypothetical protein
MTDKKVSVNANPGWLGLLGVIFVVAKVFEIGPVALWSWWLVLLPFYLGLAIVLGILAVGALGAGSVFGIAHLIDIYQRRQRRIAREKREMWDKLSRK